MFTSPHNAPETWGHGVTCQAFLGCGEGMGPYPVGGQPSQALTKGTVEVIWVCLGKSGRDTEPSPPRDCDLVFPEGCIQRNPQPCLSLPSPELGSLASRTSRWQGTPLPLDWDLRPPRRKSQGWKPDLEDSLLSRL